MPPKPILAQPDAVVTAEPLQLDPAGSCARGYQRQTTRYRLSSLSPVLIGSARARVGTVPLPGVSHDGPSVAAEERARHKASSAAAAVVPVATRARTEGRAKRA